MKPGLSSSGALLQRAKKHAITHHLHLELKTHRLNEISQKRRESRFDRSLRFFENRSIWCSIFEGPNLSDLAKIGSLFCGLNLIASSASWFVKIPWCSSTTQPFVNRISVCILTIYFIMYYYSVIKYILCTLTAGSAMHDLFTVKA